MHHDTTTNTVSHLHVGVSQHVKTVLNMLNLKEHRNINQAKMLFRRVLIKNKVLLTSSVMQDTRNIIMSTIMSTPTQ